MGGRSYTFTDLKEVLAKASPHRSGDVLGAKMSLILIGERPGLSTPESLGAYLTFAPRPGRPDSARNCVSNIHPGGLSYRAAAHLLALLVREALRRELTGVGLKVEGALTLPPDTGNMGKVLC